MILLTTKLTAAIARIELDDYVREFEVDVRCFDDEGLDDYLVGKLAMDQILWHDAIVDGEWLFQVCDNDSQGLCDVYKILCTGSGEFKPSLHINEVVDHVMFIHNAIFHPEIAPFRKGILDAAINIFGPICLAVMWREVGGLSDAELAEIGFCKIVGSELIFRQSARQSRFSEQFPRGQEGDIAASPDHEAWVKQEWEKLFPIPKRQ